MNGHKAKQLRREALALATKLEVAGEGHKVLKSTFKRLTADGKAELSISVEDKKRFEVTGQILNPVKGIYRRMKRER